MDRTTDFLLKLGTPEEVAGFSGQDFDSAESLVSNTHIHLPPNFSAFETVEQAVALAAEQGIRVLGVGNYYDFSVYQQFAEKARQEGIFPLFGTEIIALETDFQEQGVRINDPGNPGKYYICGKGITRFEPVSSRAAQLLSIIQNNDALRMREMAKKLDQVFTQYGVAANLDDQAVIDRVVKRHRCARKTVTLQERHLSQAFQERFFELVPKDQRPQKLKELFGASSGLNPEDAVQIQNEIRSHFMKAGKICFVPETFLNVEQAQELILELGGIPCYPVLADGTKQRCEFETPVEKLIETLKAQNITMVEFIPIRNHPDVLVEYVTAIREAGIAVVAGTEHNTLELLPLAPTCQGGQEIPRLIKDIIIEGMCVVAAHQFLSVHGQCGFVDSHNRPNSDYNASEERIEAFAGIGRGVLQMYFETYRTKEKVNRVKRK